MSNLIDLFELKSNPQSRIALVFGTGKTITYGELNQIISKLQKKFHKRKIVFCLFNNDEESIYLYLSLLRNNNVIFFISKSFDEQSMHELYLRYMPHYIVTKDREGINIDQFEVEESFGNYKIFRNTNEIKTQIHKDLSILISTSGSTGNPKFVRISYSNILNNTNAIIQSLKLNSKNRTITNLPFSYSYGLSVLNTILKAGGSLVVSENSFTSKDFWEEVQLFQPNLLNGVPYHYDILTKFNEDFFKELPFTTFTQAGGKINENTKNQIISLCRKFSKKFFIMYGQTEATARISILPFVDIERKKNSVGKSIPGGKIEIIDSNCKYVDQPNTIGEVVYMGNNVTLGYCENKEDLSRGNDNNFYLKTGDLGYLDEDDYLYIVGRKSRFIKVLGNRISLDDLERKLSEIFGEIVCIEVGDELVFFTTQEIVKDEIDKYIKKMFNLKIDYKIKKIALIPKTDNAKVSYGNLKEIYLKS